MDWQYRIRHQRSRSSIEGYLRASRGRCYIESVSLGEGNHEAALEVNDLLLGKGENE